MEDFQKLNFSKDLMIDGLVFVWVEKEIILPVIKFFESQNMFYVENVCWVMLDQTKRAGKFEGFRSFKFKYFQRLLRYL